MPVRDPHSPVMTINMNEDHLILVGNGDVTAHVGISDVVEGQSQTMLFAIHDGATGKNVVLAFPEGNIEEVFSEWAQMAKMLQEAVQNGWKPANSSGAGKTENGGGLDA